MSITSRAFSEADPQIPVRYEAGFVVLSYLISLVGCMSTLELLHRRTSNRGAVNWYLLIAASITMGGIGIWSMHFVGNRAVMLADGSVDRQLLYHQGYTALSFFLPIVVLLIAFHLLAMSGKAIKVHILIAGLLTGTAICAMHYVGQVGIANYDCTYRIGNIVGAAVISVMASLISLSIFFSLRETWTDSWWKRSLCAALLAGAVSGMHWTAAVGTMYHFRENQVGRGSRTRVQTVISCAVLSFASCVLLLAIALVTRRRSLVHRRRAQELVLACVYFDENDRVMVSHDGFLPYQKITNQFIRKTFGEDELSRSHPAFMWVYEASRNWNALRDFVPGMQGQLDSDPVARKYQPGHENSIDLSRTASVDFDIIFKQLFCVAAERLASQIHEQIEDLGVLFEEPLETGTTKSNKAIQNRLTGLDHLEAEKSSISALFGKGRYLFLNRRLTKSEAADFAALGYRFGSIFHVAESLARNMQVNHESMLSRLERMRICTSPEHLHPAGIHLACFILRPSVNAGFDILVPTVSQNQLPLTTLSIDEITPLHLKILQSIDEWSVRDILKGLIVEDNSIAPQEKNFRRQLYNAFVRLVDMINDPEMMMEARFSAKAVQAPSRGPEGLDHPSTCQLLSVRFLGSIHSPCSQRDLTYVPFEFFSAQQLVDASEVRHQVFKRKAELEFGRCLDQGRTGHRSRTMSMVSERSRQAGSQFPPRRRSGWSTRNLLSKLGLAKAKASRGSSRIELYPEIQLGRPTTASDAGQTSPATRKGMNVSTEEVNQISPIDITASSSSLKERQAIGSVKRSDEIELVSVADVKRSFVKDLFALFRLSNTMEKAMSGRVGLY